VNRGTQVPSVVEIKSAGAFRRQAEAAPALGLRAG